MFTLMTTLNFMLMSAMAITMMMVEMLVVYFSIVSYSIELHCNHSYVVSYREKAFVFVPAFSESVCLALPVDKVLVKSVLVDIIVHTFTGRMQASEQIIIIIGIL